MSFCPNSCLNNVNVLSQNSLTEQLLTRECLQFLATLHRLHNKQRKSLLQERAVRADLIDRGLFRLGFPAETKAIRDADWTIAPVPKELQRRWIEITGPPTRKGCINAMNSGADVWMADFEDALAPSWENLLDGQLNLIATNKRTLRFEQKGKVYKFKDQVSTLLVRPRGWHLDEVHVLVDEEPMSGSLFDFGVYFFHNVYLRKQLGLGGCFFYLPKLETHYEARLWNDVFLTAQSYLNVPIGTIRCTVLIETIGGSLSMDEILYELREHIVALNAGRWDYIFSIIKKFKNFRNCVLPERGQVTMTVPFMHAYTERLIQVCHRRGAHAIGGMSAFIPSKTDKVANEAAMKKIIEDKQREANSGNDGSWVAHPDLVGVARAVFEKHLKGKDHQKDVMRQDVKVTDSDLTNLVVPGGTITDAGVRNNINVCIQYIYYWLLGNGAVGLHNLMEDAATAEIARSQLWQWVKFNSRTSSGKIVDSIYYKNVRDEEVAALREKVQDKVSFDHAVRLTDELVLGENFLDFLTLPAYKLLLQRENRAKL